MTPKYTAAHLRPGPNQATEGLARPTQKAADASKRRAHIHKMADCDEIRYLRKNTSSARPISPTLSCPVGLYSQIANTATIQDTIVTERKGRHSQPIQANSGTMPSKMPCSYTSIRS